MVYLYVAAGRALLLLGGDILVRGAVTLARRFGVVALGAASMSCASPDVPITGAGAGSWRPRCRMDRTGPHRHKL
jgi:Ca2+/Na+ antiporter